MARITWYAKEQEFREAEIDSLHKLMIRNKTQ